MRLSATLGLAARRIWKRPVRSFLLLQGTVWGVAVAVFPSAVIHGTREAALTRATALGADRIAIAADPTSALPVTLVSADTATVRDAVASMRIEVRAYAGLRVVRVFGEEGKVGAAPAALLAADPQAPDARGLEIEAGRWLAADDEQAACVVEGDVGTWLGRERLVPGDRIRLPGDVEDHVVVGVARRRSAETLRTNDQGLDIQHPLFAEVAQKILFVTGQPIVQDGWKRSDRCVYVRRTDDLLDWIYLRVPPKEVKRAAGAAATALADRKKPVVVLKALVLPLLLGDQIDRFRAVNLAMFLACLVMGAVVMANLGLLNVLTRSREIAIRRVEGATQGAIAGHFLVEGLLLAAVGTGLGLALGMGLAALRSSLEPVSGFTWVFPPVEAALAASTALLVGLVAALFPALRAARQDPVEGLADE